MVKALAKTLPLFVKPHKVKFLESHFSGDAKMIGSGESAYHRILKHGHLSERLDELEGPGNAQMADGVGLQSHDLFSVELNRSFLRGQKPGDRVKEGGLSGAVWADESQDFSRSYFKRDPVDGDQAAKSFRNRLGLKNHLTDVLPFQIFS